MKFSLIRLLILSIVLLLMSASYAEDVSFNHKRDSLSGQYLEPTNGEPAKAVLIFVHGDGPMTYDAEGYYSILWQPLREKGYAVFSWDKPGIGDSGGNWLEQSMLDRQSEVLAAIDFVQNKYGFSSKKTGLIGFSQAGWVMPALAGKQSKIGFMIGVGFANNWLQQGEYHTITRLQLEGKGQAEIDLALDLYSKEIEFLRKQPSYREYQQYSGEGSMPKERYRFVLKNFLSDATLDYAKIMVPSLFIWGAKDKNVDAVKEFNGWQAHTDKFVTAKLIKDANHGMLDAELFDGQYFGFSHWVKLMWLEQDAVALDFFTTLDMWLEELNL